MKKELTSIRGEAQSETETTIELHQIKVMSHYE